MQSCGDETVEVIENKRTNEQISIRRLRCSVAGEDYEGEEAPDDTKLVIKRGLKK